MDSWACSWAWNVTVVLAAFPSLLHLHPYLDLTPQPHHDPSCACIFLAPTHTCASPARHSVSPSYSHNACHAITCNSYIFENRFEAFEAVSLMQTLLLLPSESVSEPSVPWYCVCPVIAPAPTWITQALDVQPPQVRGSDRHCCAVAKNEGLESDCPVQLWSGTSHISMDWLFNLSSLWFSTVCEDDSSNSFLVLWEPNDVIRIEFEM